jgi:ATP-dependent helicase/nuclease subunit A
LPNLTPHQHEAIHTHDHNLIVVAGAGSGKTYVLVERYLALLDRNPDWQLNQLVAITFTQKAAQEMRDRVREALQERLYNATDETSINLWSKRLAAMDSARIDTIHALCASILRANAAEAGVDPGFEVLDEVEAQLLLENAIDDALRGMVSGGSPALELFREYDARMVREVLADFASAEVSELPENLFEVWTTAWHTNADACLQALYQTADFLSAIDWQPDGGFPTIDDKLLDIWQGCFSCLDTLRNTSDIPTHVETMKRLSNEIKLNVGSAGAWGGADELKAAKRALEIIRESAREAVKLIGDEPAESDQRAAELLPHWYVMIQQVQNVYRQAKVDRAALDFDDLERLTRDVLRDHEHVRARYCGKEFKHVLVDEFQDTNALQWEIVQHIASPELPGSLFVVGDPKQSIYAFRGADVSVFEGVRTQISTRVGREIPLARSFRTHQILVEGFNNTFARILVRDERSPARAYQSTLDTPMEAERGNAPCTDPALEFIMLDTETYKGEDERSDKMRRWEAREIARRLHEHVENGRPVHDKKARSSRPINYGDMAILFQSMSRVTLYEDVFKSEGLPFVTVAGRGYYNRQEVWDMLNPCGRMSVPCPADLFFLRERE